MKRSLSCPSLFIRLVQCTLSPCSEVNLRKHESDLSLRHLSYLSKNSEKYGVTDTPVFKPRTAAILSRITRYEFEKLRYKGLNEKDFKLKLERKRSDYETLKERHETHYRSVQLIRQNLQKHGIETRVQTRPTFTNEIIDWADIIFTAGGDGTYLDAASKVLTDKPVIGINTDPTRSEGSLCLARAPYSATNFDAVITRLLAGDFNLMRLNEMDPVSDLKNSATVTLASPGRRVKGDVIWVSYYKLCVDDGPDKKQKSSGVTVCTGTGSSSWYFHINHITADAVTDILNIAQKQTGSPVFPTDNPTFICDVAESFNNSLKFDPSEPYMAFAVRDPMNNEVFRVPQPRGLAKKIQICSRMWDASLVVDGGSSFKFNDGAIATMQIFDEDALRTVEF